VRRHKSLTSILFPSGKGEADQRARQESNQLGKLKSQSAKVWSARSDEVCLFLSQRERIKVRNLGRFALRAQTILLAAHCRVLRELDDSKTGRLQSLCSRGTSLAFDLASAHYGSYVRRHPARSRASRSDSRNRVCKDQSDVVDGIYSLRSCDSADVARESAHSQLLFCEVSGAVHQEFI